MQHKEVTNGNVEFVDDANHPRIRLVWPQFGSEKLYANWW